MKISVVVPTFNQCRLTSMAVELLYICVRYQDWECIIVDDGSTDGTFEHFTEMAQWCPNLRVLRRTKSIGKYSNSGLARNCGIRAATGDVIACMDGDILHCTDPVSWTAAEFTRHRDKIFVTSSNWYRCLYKNEAGQVVAEIRGHVGPLPFGAWIAMHRETWFELGGYDERFTTYGAEDNDICGRLHRLGVKNIMCPGIFAVHPDHKPTHEDNRKDQAQFEQQLQYMSYDRSTQRNVGIEWGALE